MFSVCSPGGYPLTSGPLPFQGRGYPVTSQDRGTPLPLNNTCHRQDTPQALCLSHSHRRTVLLGISLGSFMISRPTLDSSHWWEFFTQKHCYYDVIMMFSHSNEPALLSLLTSLYLFHLFVVLHTETLNYLGKYSCSVFSTENLKHQKLKLSVRNATTSSYV